MLAILPAIALMLLVVCFRLRGCGWGRAVLGGAVAWGVAMVGITELLSLAGMLSRWPLAGGWVAAILVAAATCVLRRRRPDAPPQAERAPWTRREMLALVCVIVIVSGTGVTALLAPPNTWDSMTYHMSRAAHWAQNRSVAHYPTHITRQLCYPPGAEYILTHLLILSGGDRWVNLVQWLAMLGSLVGVSLIAGHLGEARPGRILAVVVAATIPMGILQASSTQNDYVLTFWVVCTAWFVLDVTRVGASRSDVLLLGGSVGLAVLTKGTAYFFLPPLAVWFLLAGAGRMRWRVFGAVVTVCVIAGAINLGHGLRNYRLYGTPVPEGQGRHQAGQTPRPVVNAAFGPSVLLSNVVRSTALHLGTSRRASRWTEGAIRHALTAVGLDPDDPRTTFEGTHFRVPPERFHEDTTGNLAHLLLFLLAGVGLLRWKGAGRGRAALYALTIVGAFGLFCFLLRWSPWHSRLHLCLFVLAAPFVAAVLRRIVPAGVVDVLAGVLIASSMLWVLGNRGRPLVKTPGVLTASRTDQYFANHKDLRGPYSAAADRLRALGATDVGVILREEDYEYPLWVLLGDGAVRIEHVGVTNVSSRFQGAEAFTPQALFVTLPDLPETIDVKGPRYRLDWREGPVGIYVPAGP